MNSKITVYKGHYKNFKIANTTFPLLKPVISENGENKAWVDASDILGTEFNKILVKLEDFACT